VLARFEGVVTKAREVQSMATVLELSSPEPRTVDVQGLRLALEKARAAGVSAANLEFATSKIESAKVEQARQLVLDVQKDISDPANYIGLNTADMRAFLASMSHSAVADLVEALIEQIGKVEQAQGVNDELHVLAYPKRGVLRVATAKLRLAIDDAQQNGVPELLLKPYRERLVEANAAQDLLKTKDRLISQLKEVQGNSSDEIDEEVVRGWESELQSVRRAIHDLEQ